MGLWDHLTMRPCSSGIMNFGTMAILDHMIIGIWDHCFILQKTFGFEKTLLVKVYVYVFKYSTITVGIETIGPQKFETQEIWDLGAMKLLDKANVVHMSLGMNDLGLM